MGVGKEHSALLLTMRWLHRPQLCPAHACSALQLLNCKTWKCSPLVPLNVVTSPGMASVKHNLSYVHEKEETDAI